jgi:type IV pilus assembly protein PilE
MYPFTPLQASTRRRRGFTLIEIMIAVVIVAILAAIALPSFQDSVRKSRRSEAFAALSALQQAQERWRGNTAEYATDAQLTLPPRPADPADPAGLGISRVTPNSYYTLLLSDTSASGYTATATGQAGQANDGTCKILAVRVLGGNISYGSSAAAPPNWADPGRCWAR